MGATPIDRGSQKLRERVYVIRACAEGGFHYFLAVKAGAAWVAEDSFGNRYKIFDSNVEQRTDDGTWLDSRELLPLPKRETRKHLARCYRERSLDRGPDIQLLERALAQAA